MTWECPECGATVPSHYHLAVHIDREHTRNFAQSRANWICLCSEHFTSHIAFSRHLVQPGHLEELTLLFTLRRLA